MNTRKFFTAAIATATIAGTMGLAYAQIDNAGLDNSKPASAYQGSNGTGPLGAHNGDATLNNNASGGDHASASTNFNSDTSNASSDLPPKADRG